MLIVEGERITWDATEEVYTVREWQYQSARLPRPARFSSVPVFFRFLWQLKE
jgi:hypothetical protein